MKLLLQVKLERRSISTVLSSTVVNSLVDCSECIAKQVTSTHDRLRNHPFDRLSTHLLHLPASPLTSPMPFVYGFQGLPVHRYPPRSSTFPGTIANGLIISGTTRRIYVLSCTDVTREDPSLVAISGAAV